MGIRASIFRSDFGSTELNVCGHVSDVVVMNVEGPFEPDAEAPAVILTRHAGNVIAVPAALQAGEWVELRNEDGPTLMAGGSYIATSDSRFREAAGIYAAIPLHDWCETWDEYNRNID
jgi:hypothetical protein